jgi:hypothetical protein
MNMTPKMIPEVDWIPCHQGLPAAGKFVWIVVGKIVEAGLARRYPKEVHMGVYIEETGKFKIYPYCSPMISNSVWAWAPMVPPNPPMCKSTESVHNPQDGEEWKDVVVEEDDDDADLA